MNPRVSTIIITITTQLQNIPLALMYTNQHKSIITTEKTINGESRNVLTKINDQVHDRFGRQCEVLDKVDIVNTVRESRKGNLCSISIHTQYGIDIIRGLIQSHRINKHP